jgi:hypothetical protein
MVLLVLVIGASLLATVARQATNRCQAAGAAERELQRRWAYWSLQAACLGRAETILTDAAKERPQDRQPALLRRQIVLGGTTFDLVLGDEQAKAGVNFLAAKKDRESLRSSILALGGARWPLQVILRPMAEKTGTIRSVPIQYATLEQVFAITSPADLLRSVGQATGGPAECLTTWGNGQVNFHRAEEPVLREMLAGVLDEYQVYQLCAVRDSMPAATLAEILAKLDLEKGTLADVSKLLTDTSNCHSLWISARGTTRTWYRLYVRQAGDAENDAGFWSYGWGP